MAIADAIRRRDCLNGQPRFFVPAGFTFDKGNDMNEATEKRSATNESPAIPSDLCDYDHYTLHEGCEDGQHIPVYQSRNMGELFAEDGTPVIYFENRLLDAEKMARAMIKVSGRTEQLERIANDCVTRREQFALVLEKASDAKRGAS